jgi:hypothetical protein
VQTESDALDFADCIEVGEISSRMEVFGGGKSAGFSGNGGSRRDYSFAWNAKSRRDACGPERSLTHGFVN